MTTPGWDRQTKPKEGDPYGWIQWKGTNVCMDIQCKCGHSGHVDDEFVYYVRCRGCGTVYMVNGHVELVPIAKSEEADVQSCADFGDEDDTHPSSGAGEGER